MSPTLAAVLAVVTSTVAMLAQETAIRLVPMPPSADENAEPSPAFRSSFAEAEAAARERHVLLLLYFTAKW